jgi:hypothetical protein
VKGGLEMKGSGGKLKSKNVQKVVLEALAFAFESLKEFLRS